MSSPLAPFLLALEDEEFFAVMRNYLGPLKTPFNKHDLIRRLERFLSREETGRRIVTYLDSGDRELLSAILTFGEPREEDLLFFFGDSRGYFDLHTSLLNLQDRLLILSNRESRRVSLNPILAPRLKSQLADLPLVPSHPAPGESPAGPWLEPGLTAALYAFLRDFPEALKNDGTLKKRARESLEERIPLLFQGEGASGPLPPRLATLLRATENLRLLSEGAALSAEALERLSGFSTGDQLLLLAAAAGGLSTPAAFDAARLAGRELLEQLQPDRAYEPGRLKRYLGLLFGGRGRPKDEGEMVLEGMVACGLLRPDGARGLRPLPVDPRPQGDSGAPQALLSPNFELSIAAEAPLADHLAVARLAELHRYDRYCRYEVTRTSFLAGCSDRAAARERIEALASVARTIPQNIRTTLEAWVSEYGAFRLRKGVVLTTEAAQATLIEHAPALEPYIRARLAEGVYLLTGPEEEWRRALGELGFEHLPPVEGALPAGGEDRYPFEAADGGSRELPWAPRIHAGEAGRGENRDAAAGGAAGGADGDGDGDGDDAAGGAQPRSAESGGDLAAELARGIDALHAGDEVKQELHRRLELKLLLYSDQLENDAAKRAASEARGLDYLGKLRIIEAALSAGPDLLEILTRRPGEEPQRILLRPSSLEKGKSDVILHGDSLPDNRPVKLQVRKIALLRKLTGTLIRTI